MKPRAVWLIASSALILTTAAWLPRHAILFAPEFEVTAKYSTPGQWVWEEESLPLSVMESGQWSEPDWGRWAVQTGAAVLVSAVAGALLFWCGGNSTARSVSDSGRLAHLERLLNEIRESVDRESRERSGNSGAQNPS
jgi:hypothetical protein